MLACERWTLTQSSGWFAELAELALLALLAELLPGLGRDERVEGGGDGGRR